MTQKKLTSSKSIVSYIDEVISESLGNAKRARMNQVALQEKEKQGGSESLDDILASDEGGGNEQPEPSTEPGSAKEPEQDSGSNDDDEHLEADDVTFDDIVEKLNAIRSGKSFKDSAIKSSMEEYVEGLEPAERTALFAFMKGIAQIVTGEIPGDAALDPSENPSNVTMQKNTASESPKSQKPATEKPASQQQAPSSNTKSLKPNVIQGAPKAEPKKHVGKQPGVEDDSPPMPVTPKRRG